MSEWEDQEVEFQRVTNSPEGDASVFLHLQ
jgi:hypothetical protein